MYNIKYAIIDTKFMMIENIPVDLVVDESSGDGFLAVLTGRYWNGARIEENRILLTENGIGIASGNLPKAFDSFVNRLKPHEIFVVEADDNDITCCAKSVYPIDSITITGKTMSLIRDFKKKFGKLKEPAIYQNESSSNAKNSPGKKALMSIAAGAILAMAMSSNASAHELKTGGAGINKSIDASVAVYKVGSGGGGGAHFNNHQPGPDGNVACNTIGNKTVCNVGGAAFGSTFNNMNINQHYKASMKNSLAR